MVLWAPGGLAGLLARAGAWRRQGWAWVALGSCALLALLGLVLLVELAYQRQQSALLGPQLVFWGLPLDVRSPDDWHAALAAFHARTGRLDLLVNNAGILISGPLQDNTLNRHNAQIDINVKGVLYGCHAGFAYLAATPGAQAINLASSAAFYGQASLANYSATKFYVRGLTEALNIEWQDHDIRVRDIMPLFVRTALVDGMNAQSIRRLGVHLTPEDVAAVVWKASQHPGWGKVHWPVGAQASILYKLTAVTPDWLNRLVARRIAV